MKKFTVAPIGLGINHIEQEYAIAKNWNDRIDQSIPLDEFMEVDDRTKKAFTNINRETGKSISNTGAAIEEDGKWKLSDSTIEKCKKYLKIE